MNGMNGTYTNGTTTVGGSQAIPFYISIYKDGINIVFVDITLKQKHYEKLIRFPESMNSSVKQFVESLVRRYTELGISASSFTISHYNYLSIEGRSNNSSIIF